MARHGEIDPPSELPAGTIDAPLVRRLIAAQFPRWAHLPVRPVERDGWDNTTFRLGDDLSVRLPSAARYRDQVEKEHRWLPRLAPQLPLPIPTPLAMGEPSEGYPWRWSVYRWLEGNDAAAEPIDDLGQFATVLGGFLAALQRIDPAGGPPPGPHNFHRGGPVSTYDSETRAAISALRGSIDTAAATAVWEAALRATWRGAPVWIHGDVAAGNLLVQNGALCAVIDFGCSGVGDPACDLTIAWTLFPAASRDIFHAALALDESTWARARGWTLWKALISLVRSRDAVESRRQRKVIEAVLGE